MNKLEGLPNIHYISLEESIDRRNNLKSWFEKYNITNYVPHLFKRFEEYDHKLVGPYVDLLAENGKGAITSHFSALKEWYENTKEEYTLIVEDDLSLETVKYWNFTWKDFFNNLPKDWNCVQLVTIREHYCDDYYFEKRKENDWCAAAYLIKREYVKLLLDNYYFDNYFNLYIEGLIYPPVLEHLLFTNKPGVYCFPLFIEDSYNTKSTLIPEKAHAELIDGQGPYHFDSYNNTINWWKTKGYKLPINEIANKKMHIMRYEDKEKYSKLYFNNLKVKFKGCENIECNYSQAFQDMFVLSVLNGKKNGTYVEIGGYDGIDLSNTYLLEKDFGWYGIALEIDKDKSKKYNSQRKNICLCENAITANYNDIFKQYNLPKNIDYLQLDIDPAEKTLNALEMLPLNDYRFSVITYETDIYRSNRHIAEKSREILINNGYKLLVKNVSYKLNCFEDWYIDQSINNPITNIFKNTSVFGIESQNVLMD